jgi:hypothetical protein
LTTVWLAYIFITFNNKAAGQEGTFLRIGYAQAGNFGNMVGFIFNSIFINESNKIELGIVP